MPRDDPREMVLRAWRLADFLDQRHRGSTYFAGIRNNLRRPHEALVVGPVAAAEWANPLGGIYDFQHSDGPPGAEAATLAELCDNITERLNELAKTPENEQDGA